MHERAYKGVHIAQKYTMHYLFTVPINEAQPCPVQAWESLGGGRQRRLELVLFSSKGHLAVLLFLEFGEFFL